MRGHALLPPADGEPYRCRCGQQYDWARSEDNPGGITRDVAREWHYHHLMSPPRGQAVSDSDKQALERLAGELQEAENRLDLFRMAGRSVCIYLDQALRGALTDGYGAREALSELASMVGWTLPALREDKP